MRNYMEPRPVLFAIQSLQFHKIEVSLQMTQEGNNYPIVRSFLSQWPYSFFWHSPLCFYAPAVMDLVVSRLTISVGEDRHVINRRMSCCKANRKKHLLIITALTVQHCWGLYQSYRWGFQSIWNEVEKTTSKQISLLVHIEPSFAASFFSLQGSTTPSFCADREGPFTVHL